MAYDTRGGGEAKSHVIVESRTSVSQSPYYLSYPGSMYMPVYAVKLSKKQTNKLKTIESNVQFQPPVTIHRRT
jgi:hypothetical protein